MEPVKLTVANNLAELRKSKGLTQQQLADIFSYSDKSISKWEHGETLPDIETLKLLCDYYGVTLDYLVSERSKDEKRIEFAKEDPIVKTNKVIIVSLAISVVWILAAVVFFGGYTIPKLEQGEGFIYWMSFIWAVPASFLLLIIFNAKWAKKRWNSWFIVIFLWTFLAAVYLQIGTAMEEGVGWTLWLLFILGVPITIAIFLFGNLRKRKNKNHK